MPFRRKLVLAALMLAAVPAAAQQSDDSSPAEPTAEQKALADSCSARKFETRIVLGDRASRVRICGKAGQTDSEWIETLRDSMRKAEASSEMEAEVKSQLVAALKAEVEALEAARASAAAASAAAASGQPVITDVALAPPPPLVPRQDEPRYSSLPPLPAPKKVAPPALGARAAAMVAAAPAIPAPRLVIRCGLPGETYGNCSELETQTRLSIRAQEALAEGTALRFLRRGKTQGEIDLAGMQPGETLNRKLPGSVCQGVMNSKVEIALVSKGQVARRLGPYPLRCGT